MSRRPARVAAGLAVLFALTAAAPALAARPAARSAPPPAAREIAFAGYQWEVKSSNGKTGPGPNYFSNATDAVWVDPAGLHLTIRKGARNRWQSTEVINRQSLGYGTYEWTLATRVDALDPNVVLGLFTWNDAPDYAHRELDIELARWGNAADPTNGQYVVQPHDRESHLQRFTQGPVVVTTQRFTWRSGGVTFESLAGDTVLNQWSYSGPASEVPVPGGENARMNLWLFNGLAPKNGQPVEVIISDFRFTPLP